MSRISLVKEYDNKDVIQQIKNLKDTSAEIGEKADKASQDASSALNAISSAVTDASEALALARPAKEKADAAQLTATDAQTKANAAAKIVTVRTDAVSGTLVVTPTVGSATENPIPIASASQTGLMNAQTFAGLNNLEARVSSLEGRATTKYVVFPNNTPTQSEITVAFTNASGRAPTAGDYATDISKAITYGFNGTTWVKVSQDTTIPQFALGEFGAIKGAPTSSDGAVIAEPDGTGSVQGWDTVKTDISNNTSSITSITTTVASKQTKLVTGSALVERNMWVGNSITVTVAGVTPASIIWVAPAPADQEVYSKAKVKATEQGDGTITLVCAKLPDTDVTIEVVIG